MSLLERDELEGWEYEVFLNFRGKDTRNNFTDVLFLCLDQLGIHTFLDDNELRHGDEIGPKLFKGIKESKIFVPIFSTNYVESKWCLRELALRLKYNKKDIRPFFYDVEPSHVKNQSGPYDEAFKAHENDKSLDKATIEEWKKALTLVGNIKGWEVPKIENGRHGAIAKKFASEVFRDLNKFSSPDITEYLVGFESQIMDVMDMLELRSEDALIIGICGIGGIGKTTLAKIIYKQILEKFVHHCFLPDVAENSKRCGIEELQKRMISNLLRIKNFEVDDVDKVVKERFCNKKVLILLDDVDDSEKINKLIKSQKCFGKGSRIIVTTRNKEIISQYEGCKIYGVKQLDHGSSLELFNKHAFGGNSPSENFVNLSTEIVSLLGGLPLSIKLVGSRLWKRSILIWKETLKRLISSPLEKLPESLRISYDQLGEQEKEIFLDIACLFIGYNKTIVAYFWESCDLTPEYSIDVLTNLSLVKIDDKNTLCMHDLLRDLGQDIVRKEGKRNGTSSRLWSPNEVYLALEGSNMGIELVKALCLDHYSNYFDDDAVNFKSRGYYPLASGTLQNFPRLIYLGLEGDVHLIGDFKNVLLELRWLRCDNDNLSSMSNFCPKSLVILDLSHGHYKHGGHKLSELLQEACNLKVLNLADCSFLRESPVFPRNSSLEMLILKYCDDLAEIDPSIWHLKFLVQLDLSNCSMLKKFPEPIGSRGGLASLTELNLQDSGIETLSNFIGYLKNLEVLNLKGARGISELPVSVCGLQKLEVIDASYCLRLGGDIPRDIGSLSNLRVLDLTETRICSLPKTIGTLGCLQELHVHGIELQEVPELVLPSSLATLSISPMLVNKISNLSMLENLQKLTVNGNYMAEPQEISCDFGVLSEARYLSISNRLYEPPTWLGSLPQSVTVDMESLQVYFLTEEIGSLSHLSELRIRSTKSLRCLPKLPSSLKKLLVWQCFEVENLGDFSTFRNLLEIDIYLCPKLRYMEGLQGLVSLRKLSICDCENLKMIYGLEQLPSVKLLTIEKCTSLRSLPNLSKFINLSKSDIDDLRNAICSKWTGQRTLESLVTLNLSRRTIESWELSEIIQVAPLRVLDLTGTQTCCLPENIGALGCLQELHVHAIKLQVVPELVLPSSLTILSISPMLLNRLLNLSMLENLQKLVVDSNYAEECQKISCDFEGLSKLESLSFSGSIYKLPTGLGSLSQLVTLEMENLQVYFLTEEIKSLSHLSELRIMSVKYLRCLPKLPSSLKKLLVRHCLKMENLGDFSTLRNLLELDVCWCPELTRMDGLQGLTSLRKLSIIYCKKLQILYGLEMLTGLEILEIIKCMSLRSLPNLSNFVNLRKSDIDEDQDISYS